MARAEGANDPATPASWNRYAYVEGDPVNNADPQGLFLNVCDYDCFGPGGCETVIIDGVEQPSPCDWPPGPAPVKPPPPISPVTCPGALSSLGTALDANQTGCFAGPGGSVYGVGTTLANWNQTMGSGLLPAGAGIGSSGVIVLGGQAIDWAIIGEAAAGVLVPEVIITVAVVAGAVALYQYYQRESYSDRFLRCTNAYAVDLKNCSQAYRRGSHELENCYNMARLKLGRCMKRDVH